MGNMSRLLFAIVFLFAFSFSALAQSDRSTGIDLYNKGEYRQAIDTLKKALTDRGQDEDLWLYIGMSNAKLDNDKDATTAFAEAAKHSVVEVTGNDKLANVLKKRRPNYTDDARSNNVQGTVKLAVELGADGKVGFIFPFVGLPHGLTRSAISAAEDIKFEPAVKDGKPVSTIRIFEFGFSLY